MPVVKKVACMEVWYRISKQAARKYFYRLFYIYGQDNSQYCGSGMFIQDTDFSIPDPGPRVKKAPNPASGSATYCRTNPKSYGSGFFPIPDAEVKKALDPGSGSATLITTDMNFLTGRVAAKRSLRDADRGGAAE
jgi:hypothetical protein